MKIENQNGEQVIILERNDQIRIKCLKKYESITLKNEGDKLNISGSSEIIGTIKGRGMLEKVYIPPVISSQEIIEKCDKWLDMFKKIHDKFKESVLKEEFRKNNVTMELVFSNYFNLNDSTIKGRTIDLELNQYNTTIQEGVTISIPEENEDVYAYLVANVLDYYVSQNCEGMKINNMSVGFNGTVYSNNKKGDSTVPMLASINTLMESTYLSRVANAILSAHDLELSTDQIIDNLRKRVQTQQIDDSLDSGILYTERQMDHIIKETKEITHVRK